MTEASKTTVEQIRKFNISYITATYDVNNLRGGNVMKNIGVTYCYSYEVWQQSKKQADNIQNVSAKLQRLGL